MTSFAGWQMPLRYASETAEHQAVRHAAGLFDLSHMGEITVAGPGAGAALDYALTGYLSALRPGRARYTMICADDGGVLDDLVVYRLDEDEFLVIANASNTERGLRGAARPGRRPRTPGSPTRPRTTRWSPSRARPRPGSSRRWPAAWTSAAMKYYAGAFGEVAGRKAWVARTGYTGEDGFEVFCRPEDAPHVWDALAAAGGPAGLIPARAWPPAIRSGLRPACRCTATSSART